MTAFVCVFFEKMLGDEKDAWELVVEKGLQYVKDIIGAEMCAELITKAEAAILGAGCAVPID